jgi:hypothetical protein
MQIKYCRNRIFSTEIWYSQYLLTPANKTAFCKGPCANGDICSMLNYIKRLLPALGLMLSTVSFAQPTVTLGVAENSGGTTFGLGGSTRLRLTFENTSSEPITDISGSLTLPDNISLTEGTGDLRVDCSYFQVSAPATGATLNILDGQLGTADDCNIEFNVTGDLAGSYNVSTSDFSSSGGVSLGTSITLSIDSTRYTSSLSFGAESVFIGDETTLTLEFAGTSANFALSLSGSVSLPEGLQFLSASPLSDTCNLTSTTTDTNLRTATFLAQSVQNRDSCLITYGVRATGLGDTRLGTTNTLAIASSRGVAVVDVLNNQPVYASNIIEIIPREVLISHIYSREAAIGGTVDIRYTLSNTTREPINDATFSHNLDAVLSSMTIVDVIEFGDCGNEGVLGANPGSSTVNLSNASLEAGDNCSFTITAQIPNTASQGEYTSSLTNTAAMLPARNATLAVPTATLVVRDAPEVSFILLDESLNQVSRVAAGQTYTVELTLTNPSPDHTLTGTSFSLGLDGASSQSVVLPPNGYCGISSQAGVNTNLPIAIYEALFNNLSLDPLLSCTFSLEFTIGARSTLPLSIEATPPVGEINTKTRTGESVFQTYHLDFGPTAQLFFDTPSLLPGDTGVINVLLTHSENATGSATDIALSLDINTLIGSDGAVVGDGTVLTNFCGGESTASILNGIIEIQGGTLAVSDSCSLAIGYASGSNLAAGTISVSTSDVTSRVNSRLVASAPANATIVITPVSLLVSADKNVVSTGRDVMVTYSVWNDGTAPAQLNLLTQEFPQGTLLQGSSSTCGSTVEMGSISNPPRALLRITGGTTPALSQCTTTATLNFAAETSGEETFATSQYGITYDESPIQIGSAELQLGVTNSLLFQSVDISPGTLTPGGDLTIQHTLTNLSDETATAIALNTDLSSIGGVALTTLPLNDVCGLGSSINASTNGYRLTEGSLSAGASCTFAVTGTLPENVETSTVAFDFAEYVGVIGATNVSGNNLTTTALVGNIVITRQFPDVLFPGALATMTLTLTNTGASTQQNISVIDELSSVIPGLASVTAPQVDVCGAGSTLSGTSTLSLSNGTLSAGDSCQISVQVQVPIDATFGDYNGGPTEITSGGALTGTIVPNAITLASAPAISATLSPTSFGFNDVGLLTILVDNSDSPAAVGQIGFNYSLDNILVVDTLGLDSNSCAGIVDATPGERTISLSGGSAPANGSCSVAVTIRAVNQGNSLYQTPNLVTQYGAVAGSQAQVTVSPTGSFGSIQPLPSGREGRISISHSSPDSTCAFAGTPVFSSGDGTTPPALDNRLLFDGLVDFTLENCTAGEQVQIAINYGTSLRNGSQIFKLQTGVDPIPMPTEIRGSTAIYSLVDGGLGDADGLENGVIVDPAGLYSPVDSIPTLPALLRWALIFLILISAAYSGRRIFFNARA